MENLFEKIMKETFLNLVKEIDFQEVQEARRVPKRLDPRKHTPKHIIITFPKIKEKERILNSKRKGDRYLQRSPHQTITLFLKRNLAGQKGLERRIQSHKRQGPKTKILYPAKLSFRMEGQIKCLPDKIKLKEFIITKPSLYEMLKGLI